MTHRTCTIRGFKASDDFKRGAAFALLSVCVFVVLVHVGRPHWATPWLLASVFTFAVWRMGRAPRR
jgi:Ca2+/Na+ antiporter